jgi:transcriptional regulator
MYVPTHFAETNVSVLQQLILQHPLGAWVALADGELDVNHLPFLLDPSPSPWGTLMGHVARANPIWRSFSRSQASVVVFQGAQAYITPSWYPSKAEHGQVVPTWNYAVVHAYGLPRAIEDRDWLLDHVTRQTNLREAGAAAPWQVSDAPADFIDSRLRGIVGVEIPITKLVGKWKVSQNRTKADRRGVAEGLLERATSESVEMAELVRARARPTQL